MATATTTTRPTRATQLQHLIARTRFLGTGDTRQTMIFEVPSRSRAGETYRVLGDCRSGGANCHCAAFRHRRACAHAEAVRFWLAARRETQRQNQERFEQSWRDYANMGGALLDL